jgi:hypothetical protein
MCQRLTVLAHDGAHHRIAQCEHGTIHLFWVRASLFLHPADLVPLLALLQHWQPDRAVTSHDFSILPTSNRQFQLWCSCAGLLLSEAELYQLRTLVSRAVERLGLSMSPLRQTPAGWPAEYQVLTSVQERADGRN